MWIGQVMITYDEVKYGLYKAAGKLRIKYNNKFETHELVNEAWLKGDFQKMENPKLAIHRAQYDMRDYIRTSEGGRREVFKKPRLYTNTLNQGEHDFGISSPSLMDKNLKKLEQKEEIEKMLNCCSEKEREILNLHFLQNLKFTEIEKITGLSSGAISKRKRLAIEKCRKQIKQDEELLVGAK
jgi:RNA polymerase sigma factor (sigma-70 family)